MLRHILLLLGILLVAGGCQNGTDESVTPANRARIMADGQYVGTFTRTTPTGKYRTANVTLTLANGRFSGSSDLARYPAIGSGTYTQTDEATTFTDENAWTADFDWTLILNGEFARSQEPDGTLVLQKKQGPDSYDTYRLRPR